MFCSLGVVIDMTSYITAGHRTCRSAIRLCYPRLGPVRSKLGGPERSRGRARVLRSEVGQPWEGGERARMQLTPTVAEKVGRDQGR